MTYWKSQQFKALQKAWYERLEAEGFKDVERIIGDDSVLRLSAAAPYRDVPDPFNREMQELYYVVLGQKVHEAEFKNEVDRLILTWYADGRKINFICDELRKLGETRYRGTIRYTIRKYEMKWGMRKYTHHQLNKKV